MYKTLPFYSLFILLVTLFSLPSGQGQSVTYSNTHPYDTPTIPIYSASKTPQSPKNIILMIGDGMGLNHIYAAWTANKGHLFLDQFPITGIVRTYCEDKLITDSAAAGSAMATGVKHKYHHLSIKSDGSPLKSLNDYAKEAGKSTGIVVTCQLNDATPASFCAHNAERSKATEIAANYATPNTDFIFGGGAQYFSAAAKGINVFTELEKQGYGIARTMDEFRNLKTNKIFACITPLDFDSSKKRGEILSEATQKALTTLSQNKKGFFLMVEGSKIDKEAHKNNLSGVIEETLDFDKTIGVVLKWMSKRNDTLLIVTADHNTGGLVILGGDKDKGQVTCSFTGPNHDGVAVPLYATGIKAQSFTGTIENTDIAKKIIPLLKKN